MEGMRKISKYFRVKCSCGFRCEYIDDKDEFPHVLSKVSKLHQLPHSLEVIQHIPTVASSYYVYSDGSIEAGDAS